MCSIAAAMAGGQFAIGAATAVSKYSAAQQDAAAQKKFYEQQTYDAEVNRNLQWNQLGLRQQQEGESASQALTDNAIRAAKARATADASGADNGVQGNSVEEVARNIYQEQGRIDTSTVRNEEMSVQQLQEEKKSAQAKYASVANHPAVRQPSTLSLGLEIVGSGLGAYGTFKRFTDYDGRSGGGSAAP